MLNYKAFILLLFFACFTLAIESHAQEVIGLDLASRKKSKKSYFKTFPDHYFAKVNFGLKLFQINMENPEKDAKPIELRPNTGVFVGVGFYLFDIAFNINLRLPSSQESIEKYGKTTGYDFDAKVYTKKFLYDFSIKNFTGFYSNILSNSYIDESGEVYTGESKPLLLPNLKSRRIRFRTDYIFSPHKYEFGTGTRFVSQQFKSGGSFLLTAMAGYYSVKNNDFIYFEPGTENSAEPKGFSGFNTYYFSSGGGYGHNFAIIRRFVVHMSLSLGPALLLNKAGQETRHFDFGFVAASSLALVYDSSNWFAALTTSNEVNWFYPRSEFLITNAHTFHITVGRRLQKVGVMKKFSIKKLRDK